jgi:hypothetical protein
MSSQPTTLISAKAKEETMDFNMPSYGETYKGDVTSSKFAPPSFNPFGDSDTKASETGSSSSQADDAAKQADTDAKQAADKGPPTRKKGERKKKGRESWPVVQPKLKSKSSMPSDPRRIRNRQ